MSAELINQSLQIYFSFSTTKKKTNMGSIKNDLTNTTNEDEVFSFANQLMNATVLPKVFHAVIELDVLEIMARAGPGAQLAPSEIVSQIPTRNPQASLMLDRMLRLLASYSVLTCSVANQNANNPQIDQWRYGLGPVCKYFVRDRDGVSLIPLFMLCQDKLLMDAWYYLKDAFIEGGIPFEKGNGVTLFQYLGTNERCNQLFNDATFSHTSILMKNIFDKYKGFDDENLNVVVDLGGGYGTTIKSITSQYPNIKGINFDLPHVIDQAPLSGVEHIGGDMFESVPKGDAIFMKNILHDWSDEQCLRILKNCYKALPDHGKAIAVEMILPTNPGTRDEMARRAYELDLIMMMQEGKERKMEEFEALAKGAGFAGFNPICNSMGFWVIEFYKRM